MNLSKILKNQGFDLIGGPTRNHQLAQIWLKQPAEEAHLLYAHVEEAFSSPIKLEPLNGALLGMQTAAKDYYTFNLGLSFLNNLFQAIKIPSLAFHSQLKIGKTVSISYEDAICSELPLGQVVNYFEESDFARPNPSLLQFANRNQLLFISGILIAKKLNIELESDQKLATSWLHNFSDIAASNVQAERLSDRKVLLKTDSEQFFPVAVKAFRLDYDQNIFKRLTLVTDNRSFF